MVHNCKCKAPYYANSSTPSQISLQTMIPSSKIITFSLLLLLSPYVEAKGLVSLGYWYYQSALPASNINTGLFTHLICAFAEVNNSTFQLSIPDHTSFSSFSHTTKSKNPSLQTLLSIGGGNAHRAVFSTMVSQHSHRQAFIKSSLQIARLYGFDGLDFYWPWRLKSTSSDMTSLAILLKEWRAAVEIEERSSSQSKLILTIGAPNQTTINKATLPVQSIKSTMDWVHVLTYDYHCPLCKNFTGASTALYDPLNQGSSSSAIREWINAGVSADKLVLGLFFYGYAWKLVDPEKHYIGAPTLGPANLDIGGALGYKLIKASIDMYNATTEYNSTYVANYCFYGTTWIGYDDIQAVTTKISYIKDKGLLGYHIWEISQDNNWALSEIAAQTLGFSVQEKTKSQKHGELTVMLLPVASVILLIGVLLCYYLKRKTGKNRGREVKILTSDGLRVFSWDDIRVSTNNLSIHNKLGEGGYGPVYKGKLRDGQEIAVKRLSESSHQGIEEFQNEVTLTARLQHVNLVRVLGFCIERGEKMLIYEYMANGSLDLYLFGIRRALLDWEKRVQIIEGVIQGLLYFQEYSRLTIIHRDLKASNILLDFAMNPKISDFGMARTFQKNVHEANTGKIVGTYGYVPPEYTRSGIYSVKSDVYSFGVLLLQMISGKTVHAPYGVRENQTLLDHAYEMWEEGMGKEFMDPALDDTNASCNMIRCLHVALLCVQENPEDRPTMLEVSSMIKSEIKDLPIPDTPAFSARTRHTKNCSPSTSDYTGNDDTVSETIPR